MNNTFSPFYLFNRHAASQGGDLSALKTQLDADSTIDLNALDDDGWVSLHYASWY